VYGVYARKVRWKGMKERKQTILFLYPYSEEPRCGKNFELSAPILAWLPAVSKENISVPFWKELSLLRESQDLFLIDVHGHCLDSD
jgi:hypothetical protein